MLSQAIDTKIEQDKKELFNAAELVAKDPYHFFPDILKKEVDIAQQYDAIVIVGLESAGLGLVVDNTQINLIRSIGNLIGLPVKCILHIDQSNSLKTFNGIPVVNYDELCTQRVSSDRILYVDRTCGWAVYNSKVQKIKKSGATVISYFHLFNAKFHNLGDNAIQFSQDLIRNLKEIIQVESLLEDEKSKKVLIGFLKAYITLNPIFQAAYVDSFYKDRYMASDVGFNFSEKEIVADVGAFNGADSILFAQLLNHKFSYIHAFEGHPRYYFDTVKTLEDYKSQHNLSNMNAHPFGVWNKDEVLPIYNEGLGSSIVCTSEQPPAHFMHLTTLDNFIDEISYLKLEIEGAENQALEGATGLIKTFKPKLCVSAYHLADDLITIPKTIQGMDKGYKFYLRHHTLEKGIFCFYCH